MKKNLSLGDDIQARKKKNKTLKNTISDFPIGTRVKVITTCQDFYFFDPDTQNLRGTVIKQCDLSGMLIVQWDEPRHYEGGHIQNEFNFEPTDLVKLKCTCDC